MPAFSTFTPLHPCAYYDIFADTDGPFMGFGCAQAASCMSGKQVDVVILINKLDLLWSCSTLSKPDHDVFQYKRQFY